MVERYVSRPVQIDAKQFKCFTTAVDIIAWAEKEGVSGMYFESGNLYIPTLEGMMRADVGDWIICGTMGEFYPCKDRVFRMKYLKVIND